MSLALCNVKAQRNVDNRAKVVGEQLDTSTGSNPTGSTGDVVQYFDRQFEVIWKAFERFPMNTRYNSKDQKIAYLNERVFQPLNRMKNLYSCNQALVARLVKFGDEALIASAELFKSLNDQYTELMNQWTALKSDLDVMLCGCSNNYWNTQDVLLSKSLLCDALMMKFIQLISNGYGGDIPAILETIQDILHYQRQL